MSNTHTKPHWSFWAISGFMLLWSVMGGLNFIAQLSPETTDIYRETEQTIIQNRPLWATIGFALSVFVGALGCIALLLRKSFALPLFIISFFGTLIAVGHSLLSGANFGVGEIVGIVLMPIIISGFLIWYAKFTKSKNWIG